MEMSVITLNPAQSDGRAMSALQTFKEGEMLPSCVAVT